MFVFGKNKNSPSQNSSSARESSGTRGTDIVRQNREIFGAPPSLMEKHAWTRNSRKKIDGTLSSGG